MKGPALIATGCGTAIACVCAIGLAQIGRAAGGVWAIAAVLIAGGLCWALARVFGRLSAVLPSGAGLLAWLSKGLGRRAGLAIAVPYLLLTLFLVGVEATIVGVLVSRLLPFVPAPVGALGFLVGTWAFCRAGFQIGFRAQTIATVALVLGLAGLSVVSIAHAGSAGVLAARMLPPAPSVAGFAAAVGTALFLFMGFELVTAQAEHSDPKQIARGLTGTVGVLAGFYALVSAGFSCLAPGSDVGGLVPQLAIAEQSGSPWAVPAMVILCLLASFTSFNGALLALSRLVYALAAQGALPKRLAKLDPKTLVPRRILTGLLGLAIAFTAVVAIGDAREPAILAAAVAASALYAAAAWVREGAPFAEGGRGKAGRALSGVLIAVGLGALAGAGPARGATVALLGASVAAAVFVAARLTAQRRNA